jgi:hypothetical protein
MTREEWEAGYIKRSDITKEVYDKFSVTLPCDCGNKDCKGWASLPLTSVEWHFDFYVHAERRKEFEKTVDVQALIDREKKIIAEALNK